MIEVKDTGVAGLVVIQPKVFKDDRGFFFESYNSKTYASLGIQSTFVQDNISSSSKGVLRGLHYQLNPFAQAKLVSVLHGKVLDIAVDIRKNSPTYGSVFQIELSEENKTQLYIPRGFAHGFVVLSEQAEFYYKCDNFYSKQHEGGIIYNDPTLNIDWQLEPSELILSEKDQLLPQLEEAKNNFLSE